MKDKNIVKVITDRNKKALLDFFNTNSSFVPAYIFDVKVKSNYLISFYEDYYNY